MIPSDCQVGPDERVMEIESKPDGYGRVRFTLYWFGYNPWKDCDGIRAQCFHAVPAEYMNANTRIVDRTAR